MRKYISALLILAGIVVMIYPKAMDIYSRYRQEKIMEEWQNSLALIDKGIDEEGEEWEQAPWYDYDEESLISQLEERQEEAQDKANREKEKLERERKAREEYIKEHMDGILTIDKIEFKQPILRGATEGNLKISVASMEHSGKPGDIGNYAIAGHRSRPYGKNFNRLDEVEEGDIIGLDDGETLYKYTVVEKLYVYPEETWVLNSKEGEREITLITCHPMKNPTHRLIVKGKILD
ncbi:MAG: class D sortase [Tissierellaceae bacterium]